MICPRLTSKILPLANRSVNGRAGEVLYESLRKSALAPTGGQDIDCRSDVRDHNRLEPIFRNAQRKATVFHPIV